VSGFVGVLRRDGAPASEVDLGPAAATLAHRGPTPAHAWCRGPVAVACVQRRGTLLSQTETLPLESSRPGLVVVHDARLDNREELASTLGLRDRLLTGVADGEILLAGWERWGERLPEHLLGDFALAIWDERERTLLLVRDQIGIRALFYFASPRLIAFASEIKALLAVDGAPRSLRPERVADFMGGFMPDRGATFYAGIERVRAGERVVATARELVRRTYFALSLPERTHRGSVEDVAAGFREVVGKSVKDRLSSAGAVGSMLSGGLDSSSIVALAREIRRGRGDSPLPTFSFVFSRSAVSDETPFIRAVEHQGGIETHFFDGDSTSPLRDLDALLVATDEPFPGMHMCLRQGIGRLAAGLGVGVLLEGNGGDTVASFGFHFLAELLRRGRLLRLAREVRGLARRQGASPRAMLAHYALGPNIPLWLRRARRRLRGRTARLQAPPFVTRELAERTRLLERFEEFWHRYPPARGEREHQLRELSDNLPGNTFELTYASLGVEPRFPFYDLRVIAYCLAVPPGHRIADGMTRMLPRRAFAALLPAEVLERTRKPNPAASLIWRFFTADRAQVEETLALPPAAPVWRYLDQATLRAAHDRLRCWSADHPSAQPTTDLFHEVDQIRKAVVLCRWLQATGIGE
jgi:asparagine synthase (glutamine-hydrolysing)